MGKCGSSYVCVCVCVCMLESVLVWKSVVLKSRVIVHECVHGVFADSTVLLDFDACSQRQIASMG